MKLRSAGMLAVCSMFLLSPVASANDYLDLLKSYLGTRGGAQSQTQEMVKTNINTRQAQLETEVQAGVNSGQLSSAEEQDLRSELNRIAAAEGSFLADGKLDNWEVQTLLDDLSGFSRRLDTYLTNSDTAKAASGSYNRGRGYYDTWRRHGRTDEVVTNQSQLQASVDARQAQLDSALEQGLNSGYIRWNDARDIQTELKRIAEDENRFLADGKLSYREGNQLISDLDAVDTKIKTLQTEYDRYRAMRRGGHRHHNNDAGRIDTQQSVLRQRINAGIKAGLLTRVEADRLYRDEQRIADLEVQLRSSGGRLGYQGQRQLLRELDDLSRKITKELNDHQVQF